MHYGKTAFSIDGSDTIIPLKPLNGQVMGQRVAMSSNDIERINMMYCIEEKSTTTEISTQEHTTISGTEEVASENNPENQFMQALKKFLTQFIKNIIDQMNLQ